MTVCVPSQQVDEVITNLTGDDMWDEDNDDIQPPNNTPSAPSDEDLQRIYGVTGDAWHTPVMLGDTALDYPMPCCQIFQDSSMIISMLISGAPNRCPNPYCQEPLSIADIPGWCDDFDDDRRQALRNAEILESDDLLMAAIRQIDDGEGDPQQQELEEYEMVQQQWLEDEADHDALAAQMYLEAEGQELLQQQAIEEHGQWLLQQQQQRHYQQALEKEVEEQQQQRHHQQALERGVEEEQQAHAQLQPQAPQDQDRQDSELLQDHIRYRQMPIRLPSHCGAQGSHCRWNKSVREWLRRCW